MRLQLSIYGIVWFLAIGWSCFAKGSEQSAKSKPDIIPVAINTADGHISFFVCHTCSHHHFNNHKTYFWFKSREVHFSQGGAGGPLVHGTMKGYYPSRQLAYQGDFKKGLKSGEWKYWHPNGSLSKVEHWKNGILSGKTMEYDTNGIMLPIIKSEKKRPQKNTTAASHEPNDSLVQDRKAMRQVVKEAKRAGRKDQTSKEPPIKKNHQRDNTNKQPEGAEEKAPMQEEGKNKKKTKEEKP